MKLSKFVYSLVALIAIVVILFYGKGILLPLVLAIMVWFLIKVVRNFVSKLKFGKITLPVWFQNIVSFALIFSVLLGLGKMLQFNISKISEVLPLYERNVMLITERLNNFFGIDIQTWLQDLSGDFNFSSLLGGLLNSISELFASTFLVILYVLFIMLEESMFSNKLKAMFTNTEDEGEISDIFSQLDHSIHQYISLKTLVSMITAVLSYVVMLIIGVDFAFFWAFLIFILNYIPTVGSLIATIFPALIALVQFNSFSPFVLVLALIGSIQVLVGNVLEPKIMGSSLNISSLVVLLALAFWGSIWGVVGMILSVPITVMMIIILSHFPGTKNIAIMLSGNGKIKP